MGPASNGLVREDGRSTLERLLEDRSLQHDVYAVIVDWIHRGDLQPGDRVSEASIARHLGVSRGPVREAIGRLAHEGLMVRRPRRGPIVPEFTAKDIDDIISVRQLLEGYTARCACQLLTSDDVLRLEEIIRSMEAAAAERRWTETALLNARFHETVVGITGNKVLARIWQTLHPLAWLLAQIASPKTAHDPESLVARHQALLDVLQAGDPDRAEDAFRQHILDASRSGTSRFKMPSAEFRSGDHPSGSDPAPQSPDDGAVVGQAFPLRKESRSGGLS